MDDGARYHHQPLAICSCLLLACVYSTNLVYILTPPPLPLPTTTDIDNVDSQWKYPETWCTNEASMMCRIVVESDQVTL